MPRLTITYADEEELCQLLRNTLANLPPCESFQSGQGLLRRLRRSSAPLPTASISLLPESLTEGQDLSPTRPTSTFGSPTSITIQDPDNRDTLIEVPLQSPGTTLPGGALQTFGNLIEKLDDTIQVVDTTGRVTTQRRVPLDLDLLGDLEGNKDNANFSKIIQVISSGLAALIPGSQPTISATLADLSGSDTKNVHLVLGGPLANTPVFGDPLTRHLLREADISLLSGDRESLERSVAIIETLEGLEIRGASHNVKEIYDRNRGNLEILRIEAQEEL